MCLGFMAARLDGGRTARVDSVSPSCDESVIRLLLLGLMLATLVASPASARTWSGKVVAVDDGDTMDVRVDGRIRQVRFIAVQAMELHDYRPKHRRGECHGVEATVRLEQIIKRAHGRVRLTASRANLIDHKGRLRRSVAVRVGGRWKDVGEMLIREGHALWLPAIDERHFNPSYNRLQQQAAQRGRNLWDPTYCGAGPDQDVPLRVWAASDPIGNDAQHINDEWIKVRNLGSRTISLGGWWVRDSNHRQYNFPSGATLGAGRTVTVHVGSGADGGDSYFWGLPEPAFENPNGDGRDLGDGAYLFDPKGDLRASMLYPCVTACSDPNQGALQIEARPKAPESIRVRNVSGHDVELYGYELALPGSAWPFPEGATVPAGGTYDVDVRTWDSGRYLLVDAGGSIRLRTFTYITLACDAWGSGSC
jgi:endonuclease YncB( thermonuclease family)